MYQAKYVFCMHPYIALLSWHCVYKPPPLSLLPQQNSNCSTSFILRLPKWSSLHLSVLNRIYPCVHLFIWPFPEISCGSLTVCEISELHINCSPWNDDLYCDIQISNMYGRLVILVQLPGARHYLDPAILLLCFLWLMPCVSDSCTMSLFSALKPVLDIGWNTPTREWQSGERAEYHTAYMISALFPHREQRHSCDYLLFCYCIRESA